MIAAYHNQDDRTRAWLVTEARRLADEAQTLSGRSQVRLMHNARAIRAYSRSFWNRNWWFAGNPPDLYLEYSDVRVSLHPDLMVTESDRMRVVKCDFTTREPDPYAIKIVTQAMFQACGLKGLDIPSSAVRYLDVSRGNEHRGARMGARVGRELEAACQMLSAIWDSI